jgi:glycosyltransferase involved in cell wall biosynthesis
VKVCAVIPAFNEEATVGNIVQETKKYIDDVFVVNNGSIDNTAKIAQEHGAEVIDYYVKRGYGAAQYAGQQFAIQKGYDYILQLDADGQHNPTYIPQLIESMQDSNYDIVLGSRFLATSHKNLSLPRKRGIIFFSRAISFLGHTKVTDATSGFKIYRVSSLQKLSKPSDINPAVEQMMEMAKKGMKIKEIPIEMPNRNTGNSHLSLSKFLLYPFRATWHILKVMLFK